MTKTFNLIFLFVFFIFSKNRTTINNDKTDVVNFNIENTVKNDFNGTWNYEFNSEENELLNKTFELKLIAEKDIIKGQYCAVAKNGRKIDCNDKISYNITGKIKDDIAYVDFKGFLDTKARGKAKIYFDGQNIIWEIISIKGEVFAPKKATLIPMKSDENNVEGLYVLKTCENSRFKIKIEKNSGGYSFLIYDKNKIISKGKVKKQEVEGSTYLSFGKIEGQYENDKIQIQNYGNSINEYIHFTQCEEKYLSFVKQ